MAPTELIAVRHGETVWNTRGLLQGFQDSPLTEEGRNEAHALGIRLAGYDLQKLYTSDLGRASETAEILNRTIGLEIVPVAGLRERNLGIVQGMTWQEVEERFPEIHARVSSGDIEYTIPDGESLLRFYDRVQSTFDRLASESSPVRILVVTHGGVINMLVRRVLGIPLTARRGFHIRNTSLNRFTVTDGEWMIETFGDRGHLEAGTELFDEIVC